VRQLETYAVPKLCFIPAADALFAAGTENASAAFLTAFLGSPEDVQFSHDQVSSQHDTVEFPFDLLRAVGQMADRLPRGQEDSLSPSKPLWDRSVRGRATGDGPV
ncbi:unnamed protein product, partial [Protopolystoma xenopodis]